MEFQFHIRNLLYIKENKKYKHIYEFTTLNIDRIDNP